MGVWVGFGVRVRVRVRGGVEVPAELGVEGDGGPEGLDHLDRLLACSGSG